MNQISDSHLTGQKGHLFRSLFQISSSPGHRPEVLTEMNWTTENVGATLKETCCF
jgi:hypothetical protein